VSSNSDGTATSALAETDSVRTLPLAGLSALAMAGFIAITTETMPAGLLVQIGSGLSVSVSGAGQLVTAYALGSVVGAVPLIALTRGLRRRAVLVSAILGFGVFNLVSAFVESCSHLGCSVSGRYGGRCGVGVACRVRTQDVAPSPAGAGRCGCLRRTADRVGNRRSDGGVSASGSQERQVSEDQVCVLRR